jgi:hypothetical protein
MDNIRKPDNTLAPAERTQPTVGLLVRATRLDRKSGHNTPVVLNNQRELQQRKEQKTCDFS